MKTFAITWEKISEDYKVVKDIKEVTQAEADRIQEKENSEVTKRGYTAVTIQASSGTSPGVTIGEKIPLYSDPFDWDYE